MWLVIFLKLIMFGICFYCASQMLLVRNFPGKSRKQLVPFIQKFAIALFLVALIVGFSSILLVMYLYNSNFNIPSSVIGQLLFGLGYFGIVGGIMAVLVQLFYKKITKGIEK